uniref:DNA replication and repair protein RecF n=1 Tax=uncultured Alphaproteobacteria bacterium TaxID=91750 RepID=A0A6M4NMR2_9PROT|nr:DNA replication and repair protein RecF [uncultured Alphaproteobacteria bacterium]
MDNLAQNIQSVTAQKSGVTRLTLTDFRNYAFLRVTPNLRPIIITGENGSGKTNILEAVSFLTPGRGMRSARLADIRRFTPAIIDNAYTPSNSSWAVSAVVSKNGDEYEIGTAVENMLKEEDEENSVYNKRIVKIEGQKTSSQGELGRYLSAIWLTPQMDRLFRGGSQPRRSFLDRLVYAFDNEHAKRTSNFEHLYKQWYQLIKNSNGRADPAWLAGIEENMATTGVAIAAARREQIARLNRFIETEPDDVFPNVILELDGTIEKMLDTMPAVDVEDFYMNKLAAERRKILYNDNVDGVNRTDFKVFYKKKRMPAELCSTGEQKSLLISIILAQTKCQILYQGFAPVLLLDEVAAHLDDGKREALLAKINELGLQAWITATNPELFASLKDNADFLEVKNNTVIQK